MVNRRLIDAVTAACFGALGLYVASRAWSYGVTPSPGIIGPGMIPLMGGLCLAGLSAIASFGALAQYRREQHRPIANDGSVPEPARPLGSAKALVIFGVMIAAIVATLLVGFIFAFAGMVFVLLHLVERRRLLESAIIAVVTGVAIRLLFVDFLNVPLP